MSQQTRYIRISDPFATQPLSKPFYAPTPLKDVDKQEAIRSPERKFISKRSLAEDRFLLGTNTYRTSALPHVKSLGNAGDLAFEESELKSSVESGKFRECWPGSDVSGEVSKVTEYSALSDGEHLSVSATHDDPKLGQKDLYFSIRNDSSVQEEKTESVLQRYIDRFRNSAPKSREERTKERSLAKQDFWWLEKSSPSEDVKPKRETLKLPDGHKTVKNELTREALLAMDEETAVLQRKADMLLCQSEHSFASSDPIVSTVGLGTSSSVSDYSVVEAQMPFRPAFVNIQDQILKPREPDHTKTRELAQKSSILNAKQEGGDILSRWRMRRKIDDSITNRHSTSSSKLPKQSNLDPRLEEFRKKLFLQKAAITQHDIDFERQKMRILLDDSDETGTKISNSHKPTVSTQQDASPRDQVDPVLRRLRQVTGDQTFQQTDSMHYHQDDPHSKKQDPMSQPEIDNNYNNVQKDFSYVYIDQSKTSNNIDNSLGDARFKDLQSFNKVVVDVFDSQIICDPQDKSHSLGSSDSLISVSSSKSLNVDILNKKMAKSRTEKTNVQIQPQNNESNNSGEMEERERLSDTNSVEQLELSKEICNKESVKVDNFIESLVLNKEVKENDRMEFNLSPKNVTLDPNMFHQVLEAEKPNEEPAPSSCHEIHNEKYDPVNSSNVSFEQAVETDQFYKHSKKHNINKSSKSLTQKKTKENSQNKNRETKDGSDYSYKSQNSSDNSKSLKAGKSKSVKSKLESDSSHLMSNVSKSKYPVRQALEVPQFPVNQSSASPQIRGKGRQSMQTAIGEAVAEHLFDASTMMSSVDSWASMFPQSPARSRSLHDTAMTPSPTHHTPLQSTPLAKETALIEVPEDSEDFLSDGEYSDDPLLVVLRQQRCLHLKQLQKIAAKLQMLQAR